jgi:hypothetical protein
MSSVGSPEEQRPTLAETWKSLREDFSLRGLLRLSELIVVGIFTLAIGIITLVIVGEIGIALFGHLFKADEAVWKETGDAQANISRALFHTFEDFGKLDVRLDYSVYAYIPKKDYLRVPYPNRDDAIAIVGKAWCQNRRVIDSKHRMPKVVLRDIQTGEELNRYRCLWAHFD